MAYTATLPKALAISLLLLSAPALANDEDNTENLPFSPPASNTAAPVASGDTGQDITADASTPATKSSVPITSGGIGEDMDRLKSVQNQYNLKLLITEKNGIFLSDVAVLIEDKKGHTLANTVTEGPILLAKLAPGTYQIKASRHGEEVKNMKVTVGSGKLNAYQITFRDTDDRISGDPKTVSLK